MENSLYKDSSLHRIINLLKFDLKAFPFLWICSAVSIIMPLLYMFFEYLDNYKVIMEPGGKYDVWFAVSFFLNVIVIVVFVRMAMVKISNKPMNIVYQALPASLSEKTIVIFVEFLFLAIIWIACPFSLVNGPAALYDPFYIQSVMQLAEGEGGAVVSFESLGLVFNSPFPVEMFTFHFESYYYESFPELMTGVAICRVLFRIELIMFVIAFITGPRFRQRQYGKYTLSKSYRPVTSTKVDRPWVRVLLVIAVAISFFILIKRIPGFGFALSLFSGFGPWNIAFEYGWLIQVAILLGWNVLMFLWVRRNFNRSGI